MRSDAAPPPSGIEICTLGPLRVRRDGRDIALRPAQRRLLAALAAAAPDAVDIDRLIDQLWVADVPRSARSMIHVHVSGIRRAVGPIVVTDGAAYRLSPEVSLTTDALREEIEAAVRDERRAPADALAQAARAVRRFRSRAFPELDDHPEGRAAAAAIDERHRRAIEVWARLMIEAGRGAETIEALDRAIVSDPVHEPYRELVMRARYEIGDHVGAVREFTSYRRLLASEVGLEPSPAIVELERRILLHAAADDPTGQDEDGLAELGQPLVGRAAEIEEVETQLEQRRLVTILGSPGMGKTRLAREVALRRRSAGGRVRFVGLVGLSDPTHVGEAVDRAFAALSVDGPRGTQSDLIVIDNADQHVATLRRLLPRRLASSDRVRVLTTSRHRIGCQGERAVVLGPFAVPEHGADLDELVGNEAVQLFVDSVRGIAPRFRLTSDNVDHVVTAVARTDGVPLSIELAAAWVPAVGVAGLGRVETGPRTLTETIIENVQTLDPVELAVMRAATSAARWFDVEMLHALASIGAPDGQGADPVTSAVRSLIDRSLIESEHRSDGRVRHRLLEPVKEAVLAGMDDALGARTRRAHRELIREHARRTMEQTGTAEEPRRFTEVDELFDDYRAAMLSAIDDGDAAVAVEIASSIWRYWFGRFRVGEGIAMLRRAEQEVRPEDVDPLGTRTLGWLLYMGGRHGEAAATLDRAAELAVDRDRPDVVIRCRLDLAQLATGQGDPDRALSHLADARGRWSRHAWPWADAVLHCRSGAAFAELGQVDTASHHLGLAIAELEAVGDVRELGLALALRSHMHRLAGEPEAALADALAAQRAARLLGDEPLRCTAGIALAPSAARCGDLDLAARAVAEVATVLPHDSAVDVCQLVLAGAAVAEGAGAVDLAARWVSWCHHTYRAAGVRRLPRLQADIADRFEHDRDPGGTATPSALANDVVEFVGRVVREGAGGANPGV